MMTKDLYVSSYNNRLNEYQSLSLEKTFGKHIIGLNATRSEVWLQAKVSEQYNGGFKITTGTDMYLFGLRYYYKLLRVKKILLNTTSKYNPMPVLDGYNRKNKKYLLNFEVLPFFGLDYNKVNHNTHWDGFDPKMFSDTSDAPSTISFGSLAPFTYIKYGSGDKVVKNYHGASIQFGFRIQFKKQDKDRLLINFLYNQGLVPLLYSPLMYYNSSLDYTIKSNFQSRGTFWSINASYPITIVNKKGERRSDRKLLN